MKIPTKAVAAIMAIAAGPALAAVPQYSGSVKQTYPHDPAAFTEGLLYQNGFLYESTGRNGQSAVRKEVLATGEVLMKHDIDQQYFGEGIVIWKDKLVELTWKGEIGFIYDVNTFQPASDFHYTGEGWALTRNADHIFMSDGTTDLRILDPDTLKQTGTIHVTCDGHPIHNINELEWVKGEIYANIWLTSIIARINPTTGKIVGLIELSNLAALAAAGGRTIDVLNGIAFDAATGRLFVTGKLWPSLYQITLSRTKNGKDLCSAIEE